MKKHAIIPIFIPHRGCPNDCVFCNQRKITAHQTPVLPEDICETVETWLSTLEPRHMETIELAFFGGSFTGLPMEEQTAFLQVARSYKDAGRIHQIHLSTRPDYISREILDNLKCWGVDVIELGVQSFDEDVLRASGRGHDASCVYESSRLIQEYGFTLGIQLMIGLPGDTMEKDLYSARETVKIGPSIARLYPTVVIRDTALYDMYLSGAYTPMTERDAVERTKEMYKILDAADINIIRVGLKSSDIITDKDRQSSTNF
ncbi:MAG: radical SAM protein, partial [Firmicutes bacterium]|nr:radical SAM protein [Bacillota bacterium]